MVLRSFPCTNGSSMSYDEKSTVSIDGNGNVLKCAKGAAAADCGFTKGAELCAKCGALPVEMKMVPVSEEDEKGMAQIIDSAEAQMEDEEGVMSPKKKKKGMGMDGRPGYVNMMDDEEEEEDEEEAASTKRIPVPMMDVNEEDDEEMEEADSDMEEEDSDVEEEEVEEDEEGDEEEAPVRKMYGSRRRLVKAEMDAEMEEDEEEEGDEEDEDDEEDELSEMGTKSFSPRDSQWNEIREYRIKSLGVKSSDIGATGYLCAMERKAYAGSTPVCDDCPGGCVAEKGLPGILHAEGLAEKMFEGVVIDSGYSSDADMFVVDVQTKDGGVKEIFIDGTTAEVMGFHRLDASTFEQKSEFAGYTLIDFTEAAEIAVKSFDGHVVAVEPDTFEGFDAYAVEIEGFDGKSYDVFVALDGEVLGYDRYEQDEVEQIEAEAAEIALKRAFSEERRMDLAKEGMALPDGSYPIVSETDLRNAIQAFGRAKDKEATKKHIMKRARALNMESLIPANWLAGSKEKGEALNDAEFMASLVEFQLLEDSADNN